LAKLRSNELLIGKVAQQRAARKACKKGHPHSHFEPEKQREADLRPWQPLSEQSEFGVVTANQPTAAR